MGILDNLADSCRQEFQGYGAELPATAAPLIGAWKGGARSAPAPPAEGPPDTIFSVLFLKRRENHEIREVYQPLVTVVMGC